jgi:Protein of unknown function (DUF4079)
MASAAFVSTLGGLPLRATDASSRSPLGPVRVCARASPRMSLDAAVALAANPAALETLAEAFRSLNMPPALVTYGHPAMMAVMVVGLGGSGAAAGWQGRLNEDRRAGVSQKAAHANIMLAFVLLAALGGLGGTLSTAMQGFDVWQSPHSRSAGLILGLLVVNAVLAYSGFGKTAKAKLTGRQFHAIFGAVIMGSFVGHAYLGTLLFG